MLGETATRRSSRFFPSALLAAAFLLLVLGCLGGRAEAQLPVRYQARPLTLPELTLRPDVGLAFESRARVGEDRLNTLGLDAGFGIGVTDDLELGTLIVPLEMAPTFRYDDPAIYGRYRFLTGKLELGAELRMWLPFKDDFRLSMGVPLLWHAGRVVRVDSGFFLLTDFGDRVEATVPLRLGFQTSDRFMFGLESGLALPGPHVPFGMFIVYTVGAPGLDFMAGARLPDVGDGFDVWQATVGASFFVSL